MVFRSILDQVGGLTDADGLLKALRHAECFDELSSDPSITQGCADLALNPEHD